MPRPAHKLTPPSVYLPWSIESYSDRLSPSQNISTLQNEADIAETFPPLFSDSHGELFPLQDQPCTIVDCTGIIVLWYLPDALTEARTVIISSTHLTLY